MAWTTPKSWAVNEIGTAANLNTHLRDNLNFLYQSYLTGIIPASGTTPTAGTGFTYTHTNGTGIYVVTFSVAFAAAPVVVGNELITGFGGAAHDISFPSVGTAGFTANTDVGGSATDTAWNFFVYAVK
jgi:hypothetical protein